MICNVLGCDAEPVAVLTLACVHEHQRTGPVCAEHFTEREGMNCFRCYYSFPEFTGHLCTLRVVEIDFAAVG
jgi:hypothetical protein